MHQFFDFIFVFFSFFFIFSYGGEQVIQYNAGQYFGVHISMSLKPCLYLIIKLDQKGDFEYEEGVCYSIFPHSLTPSEKLIDSPDTLHTMNVV